MSDGSAYSNIKACLITNPRSGLGGIDLSNVLPVLRAHGWEIIIRHKLKGGMATDLARQAVQEGCQVVVNCGGDGTLNEIVEGLTGTDTAVGCLPGGTVNLWTREAGISQDLAVASMQLVSSVRRQVDVGQLSINGKHFHHFLLMAGLGFDGTVISNVNKPLKNRIGKLAVGLAGLKSLPSFKPAFLQVEMDGVNWEGSAGQIIIGNTRRYGGFTSFTPQAYVDDGLLDICLLTATGLIDLARQLPSLVLKKHPDFNTAQIYRSSHITVRSATPIPLQLDGGTVKVKGNLTPEGMVYSISVIPQGLTVLVPPVYNDELFKERDGDSSRPVSIYSFRNDGSKGKNSPERDGGGNSPKSGVQVKIQIVELGVDRIAGVKLKNGKPVTVNIDSQTTLKEVGETKGDINTIMAALKVGDFLKVKGTMGPTKDKLQAKKMKRVEKA